MMLGGEETTDDWAGDGMHLCDRLGGRPARRGGAKVNGEGLGADCAGGRPGGGAVDVVDQAGPAEAVAAAGCHGVLEGVVADPAEVVARALACRALVVCCSSSIRRSSAAMSPMRLQARQGTACGILLLQVGCCGGGGGVPSLTL